MSFGGARLFVGLAAVALLACSKRDSLGTFVTPDAGSDEAPPSFSTSDAACSGPPHCSADLHAILDCQNNVLATCDSTKGCSAGHCVAACDAATANQSTIGCDFWAVPPDSIPGAGSCYAVYIVNTWNVPVTLTVDRDGATLDPSGFARTPSGSGMGITYAPLANGQIPPGGMAILFLSQFGADYVDATRADVACPANVTPAYTAADAAVHGTGRGRAFHIGTSAPVSGYDIFPYGGGRSAVTSATLLLPTSVWAKNYVAIDGYGQPAGGDDQTMPWVALVAAEDGTSVTISPTADVLGSPAVASTPRGVPQTYSLAKGEVLEISQPTSLSGTPIQSNKPIGVLGGQSCMVIPDGVLACDSAHQYLPPVSALGSSYAAVRYRSRDSSKEEAPPWRVMGVVDGTLLTYDPVRPDGAPTSLRSGQVVQFDSPGGFIVSSQGSTYPFYMSAHMTGGQQYMGTGDPEFVNVVPTAQYLTHYEFFTDPTYPETNLVLVRSADPRTGTFSDVFLDCMGMKPIQGWQRLGLQDDFEFSRVDLVRHDFVPQGACDNGRHTIQSAAPFGVTVWGWGSSETGGGLVNPTGCVLNCPPPGFYTQYVSYAYPAGFSVTPINKVVVPAVPQ
jgi:hypothetical protein